MTDFLLELLSEEIPARMQENARENLMALFGHEMGIRGIPFLRLTTFATPRRLALIARSLPDSTVVSSDEIKGPRVSAPPQALDGFLRKTGLTADQLTEREGVLYAVIDKPGRPTADVLAEAIPAIVRAFPWPKSMRWGEGSLRWVRPLQGIVALLGEEIVEFEIDGIASGAATVGHRFHHPGPITIGSADDYAFKLRTAHVILDSAERRAIIEAGAAEAAAAHGLSVVPDSGLVAENAGLTEWPVPLLGAFDPAFLDVPREVIQLTMRTNQKYFACVDGAGRLAPNFICTANIEALDGGAGIVAGNRKVLAARLADAKFFWEQDLKVSLEEQAKKLAGIVFHEKLGTVADKVERVAKLARWLVEEGIVGKTPSPPEGEGRGEGIAEAGSMPADAKVFDAGSRPQPLSQPSPTGGEGLSLGDMAELAAKLCKADLVTGMVGEFPELQGVMGGYYARAEGLPDEVADAIRDHYKPVGQGDDVPTAPVTVAVSLADKLDSLIGFFGVQEEPTGSRDPFALRRAALGVASLVSVNSIRLPLASFLTRAKFLYVTLRMARMISPPIYEPFLWRVLDHGFDPRQASQYASEPRYARFCESIEKYSKGFLDFIVDRLKVQQRDAGVRHDLIDAVFAFGGEDDLVRLLARVKALQGFVSTEEGADLLAGYKRAANILRKEGWGGAAHSSTPAEAGAYSKAGAGVEVDSRLRGNDGLGLVGEVGPSLRRGGGEGDDSAEAALIQALAEAEARAGAAVETEDFEGAMQALAALRTPIDAFFEQVTVNDPDPEKRAARLALLARFRDAVHRVADFSKIEG